MTWSLARYVSIIDSIKKIRGKISFFLSFFARTINFVCPEERETKRIQPTLFKLRSVPKEWSKTEYQNIRRHMIFFSYNFPKCLQRLKHSFHLFCFHVRFFIFLLKASPYWPEFVISIIQFYKIWFLSLALHDWAYTPYSTTSELGGRHWLRMARNYKKNSRRWLSTISSILIRNS